MWVVSGVPCGSMVLVLVLLGSQLIPRTASSVLTACWKVWWIQPVGIWIWEKWFCRSARPCLQAWSRDITKAWQTKLIAPGQSFCTGKNLSGWMWTKVRQKRLRRPELEDSIAPHCCHIGGSVVHVAHMWLQPATRPWLMALAPGCYSWFPRSSIRIQTFFVPNRFWCWSVW